jgi:hypothetical protein
MTCVRRSASMGLSTAPVGGPDDVASEHRPLAIIRLAASCDIGDVAVNLEALGVVLAARKAIVT